MTAKYENNINTVLIGITIGIKTSGYNDIDGGYENGLTQLLLTMSGNREKSMWKPYEIYQICAVVNSQKSDSKTLGIKITTIV